MNLHTFVQLHTQNDMKAPQKNELNLEISVPQQPLETPMCMLYGKSWELNLLGPETNLHEIT